MRLFHLLLVLAISVIGLRVEASTARLFDYTYVGKPLLTEWVSDPEEMLWPERTQPLRGYGFTMRLDESQFLFGSLRNATVRYSACSACLDQHSFFPGLVGLWDRGDPTLHDGGVPDRPWFPSWDGLYMEFSTNEDRQIVSFAFGAGQDGDDGVSAGLSSLFGDTFTFTDNALPGHPTIHWASAGAGKWSVAPVQRPQIAPVPLPPSVLLAAAGIAAFIAVGRRRTA